MPDYHGRGDDTSATALFEVLHLGNIYYMRQKQVKSIKIVHNSLYYYRRAKQDDIISIHDGVSYACQGRTLRRINPRGFTACSGPHKLFWREKLYKGVARG